MPREVWTRVGSGGYRKESVLGDWPVCFGVQTARWILGEESDFSLGDILDFGRLLKASFWLQGFDFSRWGD